MTVNTQRTNTELDRQALQRGVGAKSFFRWEWLLVAILVAIIVVDTMASGGSFLGPKMFQTTTNFMDKSFLVLSMAFVIILGKIDISVGSATALCSVLMAVTYDNGLPIVPAILLCVGAGMLCGMLNGLITIKFPELHTMIITLSTMVIYRGIATIILEDRSAPTERSFPEWFQQISWGTIGFLPYALVVFAVAAAIFAFTLHKTKFGRELYAIGNNAVAAAFSRIHVNRAIFIAFMLNGLMAGVCALFLTSRMASTRPNVASGYELEAIAMVVLAGIPTAGGKGSMFGVIVSVFIIGYLRYGLGLYNISAPTIMVVVGALLIGSVLASHFWLSKDSSSSAE
jgi:rhamnose transport system permease protein